MDDVIYRQAAIEALGKKPVAWVEGEYELELQNRWRYDVNAIKTLPSVDAVLVVRCEDCRWGRKVCGNIECFVDRNIPPEYHSYDWFCPKGERRTDE